MSDPIADVPLSPPAAEPVHAPGATSSGKPRGLFGDAWAELRTKPMFWIAASFITLFVVMAAFPQLFAHADPTRTNLDLSRVGPSSEHWFGNDKLGRDVYARCIYGAQASIVVSLLSTLGTLLLGGAMGVLSGYVGGWVDAVLSRIADVFFGLPFVLGALIILFTFNPPGSEKSKFTIEGLVILSLVLLSWPVAMRLMRAAVLATREADYIVAARALGAGPGRIIRKHLIPNCLAPMLVYATILVGSFIGAEATLSFLGVGLKSPVVSWGIIVSEAKGSFENSPFLLGFPAIFLVTAVLSFVMLGEAIREALDPKLR